MSQSLHTLLRIRSKKRNKMLYRHNFLPHDICSEGYLVKQVNWPRQEGPCEGVKRIPGLAMRPQGDCLGTLLGQTRPKLFTLKAIGVCMGAWFDGF